MTREGLAAYIVFSADPHLSEYLPKNWQERTWLTGFTGSAGFVVITQNDAALWTDGRYFVQAKKQLADTGIQLMKGGEPGVPEYEEWLTTNLEKGVSVGLDYRTISAQSLDKLKEKLSPAGIDLKNKTLLQEVWEDRPAAPSEPIFLHPKEFAGKSAQEKLAEIRGKLEKKGADAHIITALDEVAWTTNLRGADVNYNPVFLGYLLLDGPKTILFAGNSQLSDELQQYLKQNDISVRPYADFEKSLAELSGKKILLSPLSNQAIRDLVSEKNSIIIAPAPGNLLKAIKNEAELEGFRSAMVKDGVAMVKFLHWLKTTVGKTEMTEYSIGLKLKEFRSQQEGFFGESFGPIVGYRDNGAVIHYSAKAEGSNAVEAMESLLVDSGGQYREGTTDITRTVVLGEVSEEFRHNATLVLKGMIDLSMAQFPQGTRGFQLDAIARLPLWMEGKDYNHGTGHGVGSFMNVHEGPQNIRKDANPQELLPGMVVSNEPGFYKVNGYGIRMENLIAVENSSTAGFLKFETLTICPFDRDALRTELLSSAEKDWLNAYHRWCFEKLSPYLEGEELDFLRSATKEI